MTHASSESGSGPGEFPLDHVAIAVRSIGEALPSFEAVSGAKGSPPEILGAQGVRVCFIGEGPGRLELLEPTGDDTPVGRFLDRRGPGLHHIAYRVPDLVAALASLERQGMTLIDREPRTGAGGHKVAFVHPRSTNGTLVELVEG